MTKKEIIKALEPFPDDTPICLVDVDEEKPDRPFQVLSVRDGKYINRDGKTKEGNIVILY